MNTIHIGKKTIGVGHPTYIIAEVGSNFDGNLERAKSLAKLAKELGADAYKIQNFLADRIASEIGSRGTALPSLKAKGLEVPLYEAYKGAEFPREWIKPVADYCKEIDIDFFGAPYDREAVELLEQIDVPVHKLGSGEIDNLEFLEYIAKLGRPMIISCGTATFQEVERAIATVRAAGNEQIVLTQCISNYPSSIADANIRAMAVMGEKLNVLVGYSDHTIGSEGNGDDPLSGITVPLGAVALGAVVIEKHFTDDRTLPGPDHPFAMEPDDFRRMVQGIRTMEKALGDGEKRPTPSEEETVATMRRGICARVDIVEGATIERDMLEFLRPAVGLRPPEITKVVGKTATHAIPAGTPIYSGDFKE
jgi:sialic acid synthase SpsE